MARMRWPSPRRGLFNAVLRLLLWLSAALTGGLLVAIVCYVCYRGLPGLSWQFLSSAESILQGTAGILPSILNTLYVIILSLLIVLPLGVGAAVYLTEYARSRRLTAMIEFAAETLAGIPSMIYALVGVILFCTA